MESHGIEASETLLGKSKEWSEKGWSVVSMADEKNILCLIAVSDRIRPGVAQSVSELERIGLQVHMLTGDNDTSAAIIARQSGISSYRAGMLPADKLSFIRDLQLKGHRVAMVGDGINDSPALAQADVGIAIGTGTDIAMESSQVILIRGDLEKLVTLIKLSGRIVSTIRQNLFWAFFYNSIGIPVAAGILYPFTGFLLNPMIAGAAMAFSSVSVVVNSLRLRRVAI
jgi:Cu2+-exporting ATPase